MPKQTKMETIKIEGGHVIDQIKRLIHEGNLRRIIVKQEDRVVAEFPLTFGVIGVVVAPVLAAISTLVALLSDCSIEIERFDDAPVGVAYPITNGHVDEPGG
jgi:hypothetical protein